VAVLSGTGAQALFDAQGEVASGDAPGHLPEFSLALLGVRTAQYCREQASVSRYRANMSPALSGKESWPDARFDVNNIRLQSDSLYVSMPLWPTAAQLNGQMRRGIR
jgi:hypothetical protein